MTRFLATEAPAQVGQTITVKGWIHARRDMGKLAFFDLRDRSGLIQIVCVPSQMDEASKELVKGIRTEWCVSFTGSVQPRQPNQVNAELPTGGVELLVHSVQILNEAKTPPFEVNQDTSNVNEEPFMFKCRRQGRTRVVAIGFGRSASAANICVAITQRFGFCFFSNYY